MNDMMDKAASRRAILRSAAVMVGGGLVYGCTSSGRIASAPVTAPPVATPVPQAPAAPLVRAYARNNPPPGVREQLFERAMAALDRNRFYRRDRIAIADFTDISAAARLHLINLEGGPIETMLVSHGSGSDPSHTGYLQRFSGVPGSEATSEGAYRTESYYVGQHGLSQRLTGLDHTNYTAMDRAIVIHSAWYANADMVTRWGKLGRSQGCFAVGETKLDRLFRHLGTGTLLYAGKV